MKTSYSTKKGQFYLFGFRSLLAMALLSSTLFVHQSSAEETRSPRTFDIKKEAGFKNYKNMIRQFALKHGSGRADDFCIVGYVDDDGSKQAWVLWPQGEQIILWESGETNLDFSRRIINLRTDVVEGDSDVEGSTYLVTRAWINNIFNLCDTADGTKLHIGKSRKSRN